MAIVKTKNFSASLFSPLPTPDGSSLEEIMNVFLATLAPKDVLDVLTETESTGKYGANTTHTGTVVYKV